MPRKKDVKRVIRQRMAKTGESYTAARAHVVKPESGPQLPEDYERIAGQTDETTRRATGRAWPEWISILDDAGAMRMSHRDTAALLREAYGVSGWWSQSLTVGYERLRGLREVGQRRGGGHEMNKSMTVAVPVEWLWEAVADERMRAKWLRGIDVEMTSGTPNRTVNLKVSDGTRVVCGFSAKGEAKSVIAIAHRKLEDQAAADRMRAFWSERLDALRALVLA